jgi:hypothetical protein
VEKAAARRVAEENAAALAAAAAAAAAAALPTHTEHYTVEDSKVETVLVDRADLRDESVEEGDTGTALKSKPMDLADDTIA